MAKKATAKKAPAKKAESKPTAKKTVAKKASPKKAVAKKAEEKKPAAKKTAAPKKAEPKATASKAAAPKSVTKKAVEKKAPAVKTAAAPVAKKEPKAKASKSVKKPSAAARKTSAASKKAEDSTAAVLSANGENKPKIAVAITPKKTSFLTASVRIDKTEVAQKKSAPQKPGKIEKLSPKETREIKERLIKMRETTINDIRAEISDSDKTVKPDEADMATDFAENAVTFEMARSGSKALEAIDTALMRIEEGSYGQCECCDAHIPKSRLKVLPFATLCAVCKQDSEFVATETTETGDEDWDFSESSNS